MDTHSANEPLPVPLDQRATVQSGNTRRRRRRKRATDHAPRPYARCDRATGVVLLVQTLVTPWALGGEGPWAVWLSSLLGLALGVLLVAKHVIRQREGFQPTRWGEAPRPSVPGEEIAVSLLPGSTPLRFLALLQAAGLAMIFLSLLHATPVGDAGGGGGSWLPHTIDRATTLRTLVEYCSLVCVFWAARDWMLYRSTREQKASEGTAGTGTGPKPPVDPHAAVLVPKRLRFFLWVLSLNGTLLAVVSYLQHASGTGELLWLFDPPAPQAPEAAFGPWAYRANAAHYFNLLWPVCLGFWLWMQERASRLSASALARFDGPQVALLPCAAIIAAAPTLSGTRSGTLVSMALAGIAVVLLFAVSRREVTKRVRLLTLASIVSALVAMLTLGWGTLRDRFLHPDHQVPTGLAVDNHPFSLLLHLRVPPAPPKEPTPLARIRGDLQGDQVRRSATVGLSPDGSLAVQFFGETAADTSGKTLERFVPTYAGKDVYLTLIRDRELRIFVDGKEASAAATRNGDAPGWLAPIESRYVNVTSHAILEVALLDAALRADEIPAPPFGGFAVLGDRIQSARVYRADGAVLTNRLALVDGVTAELRLDTQNPSAQWTLVRRTATAGPLGFVRPLPGADPLLRGAVRISFIAKNTTGLPLYLVVNVDGGDFASVEVSPRSEQTVSARCRIPHDGAPSNIGIAVADRDDPNQGAVQPAESQILVRDLQLGPATGFVSRTFNPELRAGMFGVPFEGLHEVAQVAHRIAADHAPWGSGAGTFALAYRHYAGKDRPHAPSAYNDWLETRVTMGWFGIAFLAAAIALLLLRSGSSRGIPTIGIIIALVWIALAGCLAASTIDSPLQNHAVLQLFTVFAALAMSLGAARAKRR